MNLHVLGPKPYQVVIEVISCLVHLRGNVHVDFGIEWMEVQFDREILRDSNYLSREDNLWFFTYVYVSKVGILEKKEWAKYSTDRCVSSSDTPMSIIASLIVLSFLKLRKWRSSYARSISVLYGSEWISFLSKVASIVEFRDYCKSWTKELHSPNDIQCLNKYKQACLQLAEILNSFISNWRNTRVRAPGTLVVCMIFSIDTLPNGCKAGRHRALLQYY
jgi:hypothetical protein